MCFFSRPLHERISVSNPVSMAISRNLDIVLPIITVSKLNTSVNRLLSLSTYIMVYAKLTISATE